MLFNQKLDSDLFFEKKTAYLTTKIGNDLKRFSESDLLK